LNTIILSWVTFIYLIAFFFSILRMVTGKEGLDKITYFVTITGLTGHTAGLIIRWFESYKLGIGHAPLSNLYESLVFFAWTIVVFSLVIERKREAKGLDTFVLPVAFLFMAYASFSPNIDTKIQPLIPALKSNWLVGHVITCFLGYAAFVVASIFSFIYLLKDREKAGSISKGLPDKKVLERYIYQSVVVGYILFSLGIITGSVWAYYAWGTYWGWDPKETWALITWLIFTAALHSRLVGKNRGRHLAILTLIGLISVFFTYLGVNYLPGLHSYLGS